MTEMRVLSLWQPWASLWVLGRPDGKGIETRSWGTDYRGTIVVHAARTIDVAACYREPFRRALSKLGYDQPEDLPRGALVGEVDLVACLRMREHHVDIAMTEICVHCDPRLMPTERAFGLYEPGRFAWMTGPNRRQYAKPIPWRGGQGLRKISFETINQDTRR